ncbi:DUF1775 domain-containing protein [Micromonospora lutea]|uniref:YncI copper-binding domain-containing protein n=1 Tax=Micromonospora lutea TaxID=419825 RepID=A0ABQ4J257_9ACTN|nr:DUF1775 domain-containing protein [Micromonospora lutea]GIJ24095.1 hypothetical protein Vlu01_47190 [Micromonospora lutea]
MNPRRWVRTVGVATAASIGYLALGAVPAAAHVEVAGARPNGDGTTTVTFSFDHSCDGSPTTELIVALPGGVSATDTVPPDGWAATIAGDRITFTGPGQETAEVGVTARIVARAGDTLHFPVLQRCADGGAYDWIDITADSERPAPRLIATNAVLAAQPEPSAGSPVAAAGDPDRAQGGGATLRQASAVLIVFVAAAAVAGFVSVRRQ